MHNDFRDPLLDSLIPTSFTAFPVRSNYDMVRRSKDYRLSDGALNRLATSYDRLGAGALSIENISATVPEIVSYSSTSMEQVLIPNGWGSDRLNFTLTLEASDGNNIHVYYINGYTDRYEVSLNGQLALDTIFFVSSVVNTLMMPDGRGGYFTRISQAYDVLSDPITGAMEYGYDYGFMLSQTEAHRPMRPEDMSIAMSIQKMNGEDNSDGFLDPQLIDTTGLASKHTNNSPLGSVATTLAGYATATQLIDDHGSASTDFLNGASIVKEHSIDLDPFFSLLGKVMGRVSPTFFSFADMITLFPKTQIEIMAKDELMPTDRAVVLDGDDITGTEIEAGRANMFIDGCRAVMSRHKLVTVGFKMTNRTHDGNPETSPIDPIMSYIEGVSPVNMYAAFITYVESYVFPTLVRGRHDVEVIVFMDVSSSHITIMLDGGQPRSYSSSDVASSLSSPTIGTTSEYINTRNMLSNLTDIITSV